MIAQDFGPHASYIKSTVTAKTHPHSSLKNNFSADLEKYMNTVSYNAKQEVPHRVLIGVPDNRINKLKAFCCPQMTGNSITIQQNPPWTPHQKTSFLLLEPFSCPSLLTKNPRRVLPGQRGEQPSCRLQLHTDRQATQCSLRSSPPETKLCPLLLWLLTSGRTLPPTAQEHVHERAAWGCEKAG